MLTTLRIKNLALVADLTLDFRPGFCAVTGETGAGKSIVLGALKLVLGERADRTAIRAGAEACSVEALFDISRVRAPIADFLEENGLEPCEGGQLILKRAFSAAGSNRQFVNGTPTTLSALEQIGGWLVDLHGPHEHQSLLNSGRQLNILDAFAGTLASRQELEAIMAELHALTRQKQELTVDDQTYAQRLDLARFQVQEITQARLQPGEEEELNIEHQRGTNASRLLENCRAAIDLLQDQDGAIVTRLMQVGRLLQEMQRLDSGVADFSAVHQQAVEAARELLAQIEKYGEQVQVDPERLAAVEERLNLIHSLKRKYGHTIADILAAGQEAEARLQSLESRETEVAKLNTDLARREKDAMRVADDLSRERRNAAGKLAKAATKELNALGFRQSSFAIDLTAKAKLEPSGLDAIEFQFAPNPGEPARPLRSIASSGELARVMLALKTALAAEDDVPVLLFDEVDANVGGETARVVGQKMKEISRRRQVLCITHLPRVAVHADAHYLVSKIVRLGRTETQVTLLENTDRLDEIARMLGGGSAARRHAEEMLEASR